ncbi:hypothetical protein IAI10_14900 [Clostridium sp. 19966]|uniref:phage holin, LLH family n=1 Tax=Clostridium sp. 19966 TaxID=2768166 RepID=UPI0028DF8EB9|nr:phage holin, LLH family [Clostridium sp. 19966]MDT8717951.1 hypothetical protein [Clostridium sp. 19966]
MDINQIAAYVISIIILSIAGYIGRQIKVMKEDKNSFYNKILEFKSKEENRAIELMGKENEEKAKQIIKDAVYRAEQLGKEMAWDGATKHTKALEFIESELKKAGLTVTDEEIFNLIKTTVGYINAGK